MKFTLERILIIIQVVLLIGKITGWLLIPWYMILSPLWSGLLIGFIFAYITGYVEESKKDKTHG